MFKVSESMAEHVGEGEVEEHRNQHASLLHVIWDLKKLRCFPSIEYKASHMIMEEVDHFHKSSWLTKL